MKRFLIALVAAVAVFSLAPRAEAQFKAKAVSNPPGLFNRTVARSSGSGGASAAVAGRGGGAAAAAGGGFRGGAAAASAGGGFRGGVASASVGGFNNGFNSVAFRGFNHGFNNPGVAVASVGGFNHNFNQFGFNAGHNGAQAFFVNRDRVRFNSFGTATVQDGFGNVFEVDAFGNSRFVGNRLGSSAIVTGFVPTATGFHGAGFGFRSNCH